MSRLPGAYLSLQYTRQLIIWPLQRLSPLQWHTLLMAILRPTRSLGVLACFAVLLPGTAVSQQGSRSESAITLGPAKYDLTQSGNGFAAEGGVAFRPGSSFLVLEPSLGYFTRKNDFDQRVSWYFPELSVEVEKHLGRLRPFFGGGVGFGVQTGFTTGNWKGTLHGVVGIRLRLGRGWGTRVEVRWRAVPPFSGHTEDLGFGLIRGIY
jgi:hypothetical protein